MQGPWHLWLRAPSMQGLWRPAGLRTVGCGACGTLWTQGLWRPGLWRLWPRRPCVASAACWHPAVLAPLMPGLWLLWHQLEPRQRAGGARLHLRRPVAPAGADVTLRPRGSCGTAGPVAPVARQYRRLWHLWLRRTLRPRWLLWHQQACDTGGSDRARGTCSTGHAYACGTSGSHWTLRACGPAARPGWTRRARRACSGNPWNDR
jgi:hypothetical protein